MYPDCHRIIGVRTGNPAAVSELWRILTPLSNPSRLIAMKSVAGPWNHVAVIQPSSGCHTVANRSQSPASRHSAQSSTS